MSPLKQFQIEYNDLIAEGDPTLSEKKVQTLQSIGANICVRIRAHKIEITNRETACYWRKPNGHNCFGLSREKL